MPSLSAAAETARRLQAIGVDVHLGQRLDESIENLANLCLSLSERLMQLEYRLDKPREGTESPPKTNSAPT